MSLDVWLQVYTKKFHKSFKALPRVLYKKIELGLDANKARGTIYTKLQWICFKKLWRTFILGLIQYIPIR